MYEGREAGAPETRIFLAIIFTNYPQKKTIISMDLVDLKAKLIEFLLFRV